MAKINIQVEVKCAECGAEITFENLGALETIEQAQDWLSGFETETIICSDCEEKENDDIRRN